METSIALNFTPSVGDLPFTPQQRSLLSLAHELGRTKFSPRAAQWDREASFPFANYDDLRDAGLLAMCVPEKSGGLGADYATYMMVAAEIGRFCGVTALTWNMHICSTMWTGVLADGIAMTPDERAEHERRREIHFARVVKAGAIYAQPFSEGSAAAAGFTPRVAQEARELDTLIALVSAGLGVTLVPASAARFPRPGVMFLPLAGEALSFRLVALRRRGLAPPAVRSFLEVLYEVGGGD